jgi:sec-independent protein translocase protein TatA
MPQIGPLELIIVLVIALLVLGPGRLPDVGAALGKSIREFRKATSDVQEATKIDVSPLPPTSTATPAPAVPVAAAPVAAAPVAAAPTSTQPPTEPQA